MNENRNTDLDNVSDYVFDSIVLISERISDDVDIKEAVSDLEIYENLDLPYLTAKLVFVDNANVMKDADILGGEKIEIQLRSLKAGSKSLSKTFYISKIISTERSSDHTEVNYIELIEDIVYISNLKNVNRYYSGSATDIIEKISENFLSKEIGKISSESVSRDLIVPNLSPVEAMLWLRNTMSTVEGYPFYLFSTFFGEKLALADLGTLLQITPINPIPYRANQGASVSQEPEIAARVLNGYRFGESEDLYKLIRKGVIGSNYNYINTLNNKTNNFSFDVVKDFLKPLIEKGTLGKQKNVGYTPEFELDGIPFNELKSRTITRLGSSLPFRTDTSKINRIGYSEEKNIANYKRRVTATAMNLMIKKSPLHFAVDGLDFITGNTHFTIGNNVDIQFLAPLIDNETNRIDTKRSGKYLIYSAKHVFKKEKYDLIMTGIKMGNPVRI